MSKKLVGKVALVTGASKGIGSGLAVALASERAVVAINYKTDERGAQNTLSTIRKRGGDGGVFRADIGRPEEFEEMIETTCKVFGGLDILVNNATRTRFAPFERLTKEDFEDVINTNLRGPFFGSAAAARKFLERDGGSIINVSSCAARLMLPFHSAYAMAKGGLEALTRQLALELAPRIRVNAIAPGPTATERNRGYDSEYDRKWGQVIPAGRVAKIDDYAGICIFLASNDSAWVTGQIIGVDGGWTIKGHSAEMPNADFSKDRNRDEIE